MVFQAQFPPLDIPKVNILSYLFPQGSNLSEKPIWASAENPSMSLSSASVVQYIKRFAVGLDKLSIPTERAIMMFSPNHVFVPMLYLATTGSKRYFTGANPAYTVGEVAYQMKTINAALVLVHPTLLAVAVKAAKRVGIPTDRLYQFSDTKCHTIDGIRDWRTILASESEARLWAWDSLDGEKSCNTIAAINFSSGTTGVPKGVCISHYNLVANMMQVIHNRYHTTPYSLAQPDRDERWLAFLPLYHGYSQLWTISVAVKLQASVYIMGAFNFVNFLSHIQQYKISGLQVVPPVMVMLSKRPETVKNDISSVRHIMSAAAPLSAELQNEVHTRFGMTVTQCWGMTETTCVGISAVGKAHDVTGNIGMLLPNTEVKLLSEDGTEIIKDNEAGEMWIRGPQIMLKYWNNEEATRESKTADGWLRTGDVAFASKQKFWIVDRKKELIKVNGLQVAPAEIEAVLLECDDVADAAVVGIMLHGEEYPRAYVVLQETSRGKATGVDIARFVEERVAKHKRLIGGVKFIDQVPKLASGKIIRKQMKEWSKRDAAEVERTRKARL